MSRLGSLLAKPQQGYRSYDLTCFCHLAHFCWAEFYNRLCNNVLHDRWYDEDPLITDLWLNSAMTFSLRYQLVWSGCAENLLWINTNLVHWDFEVIRRSFLSITMFAVQFGNTPTIFVAFPWIWLNRTLCSYWWILDQQYIRSHMIPALKSRTLITNK